MNIQDATKRALLLNGYITGSDKKLRNFLFIKPTDGVNCCIIYVTKDRCCRGWQPHARDLVSNNWEVVTEEEFLQLSKGKELL